MINFPDDVVGVQHAVKVIGEFLISKRKASKLLWETIMGWGVAAGQMDEYQSFGAIIV